MVNEKQLARLARPDDFGADPDDFSNELDVQTVRTQQTSWLLLIDH
jgi:hypothetical protein